MKIPRPELHGESTMKARLWSPILGAAALCLAVPAFGQEEKKPASDQQALFDRIDQNKDGVITAADVPEERKSLFERLARSGDKNGDGKITREEFASANQDPPRRREAAPEGERRPMQPTGAQLEAMFRNSDAN